MKAVSLTRDSVHTGSLILVNKNYPFYEGHCKKHLLPVTEKSNKVLMEMRAATILQKLMVDMECEERIIAISGFRSKYEQTHIYENSLIDNGAEFTAKYVALPNHSEHQTGLAVDLALNQPGIDTLRPYFPYTGDCGAFRSKSVQFGFIERYLKGKEDITGIAHEPWHFRYVGSPHSQIMQEMGLVLEEYLFKLKEFPYGNRPFRYALGGLDIDIFYLASKKEDVIFEIEEDLPYSVSGDNMGGFIVTIWRGANENL